MVDVVRTAASAQNGALHAADTTAPAPREGMEQAWLRELERAQWSQRPAETRLAPAKHGENPAAGESPRPGGRSPVRDPALQPRSARPQTAQTTRAAVPESRLPAAVPEPESPAAAQEPAASAQAPGEPAPSRPSPALEAAIAMRLWGARRAWERRKALVLERGGRVRVWLRDAELSPSEIEDTVARLAVLMRESGLELEAVTINGCVVFERSELGQGAGTFG
jgi:hypothetical protein